jgi:hypothetical protein
MRASLSQNGVILNVVKDLQLLLHSGIASASATTQL